MTSSNECITVALTGNPNCGKTTLFNNFTGLHHHVGNWPGKTVTIERKEGKRVYEGTVFDIIDLPGTYSLSGRSLEEDISIEFLTTQRPDVVLNIVDASRLERHLYLTLQLIELGVPLIVALNMNRFATEDGIHINADALSKDLGVPVIPIEAIDNTGKKDLIHAILSRPKPSEQHMQYSSDLEDRITEVLSRDHRKTRWNAILELIHGESTIDGIPLKEVFANQRYAHIDSIVQASVTKQRMSSIERSRRIDDIVTHKWLGFPIFLAVMYLLFQIVFTLGAPFMALIEKAFSLLAKFSAAFFSVTPAPKWVVSFVSDGVIGGVGSVIIFLPNILLLFLLLAILEDSGYLTRVAVIMDAIMKKIGLHGKSFIPMILGFGCSVPAIMAARTLESEREKFLTILMVPFMSCGARLPVYLLFTSALFAPSLHGVVMFSLYLLGIFIALLVGFALQKTLFTGESSPFLLEMPPFRAPRVKAVLFHAYENGWQFLRRAGVIIFPAVLFMWLLASLPFGVPYASSESVIGVVGTAISPIFAPLGFGEPEFSVALLMGLIAKEVVIGTLGSLYGASEGSLGDVLHGIFTPLSAYSFMVFVLLYIPCFAAMLTVKQETGSWKLTGVAAVGMFVVAWIASFLVYQGGTLLGFS
ncbi:MAG: ferrous iron transport protein B [Methanomicrobiales archaeon]|nr:ferrous iron transport protein B [Methanomicrobiales archaeon]